MPEDDKYIIKGPLPVLQIPNVSAGQFIYDSLIEKLIDKEAIVDAITGKYITYKEILGKTCSLAQSLKYHNYEIGSVAAICSENILEYFIPIISCLYLGITMAPINPEYTEYEMKHMLNITKPEILFCSKKTLQKIIEYKLMKSFKCIIVINGDKEIGEESMEHFIRRSLIGADLVYRFLPVNVNPTEDIAFILSSSGTTGLPKGVAITHMNVVAKLIQVREVKIINKSEKPGDINTLAIMPFFHAYGLFAAMLHLDSQYRIVMLEKFEVTAYLEAIQKYKIAELLLVPTLANFLAKSPLVNKYDLSSIKTIGCGAAPLSKDVQELLIKKFKVDRFIQGYGLTESTLGAIGPVSPIARNGAVGKLFSHMLCKIRDPETGRSLGPLQIGEICFKGPIIMKGYYNNPKATRETFTEDGWLLTGDLGYYDEDEFFYIVDRLKELIKYKGYQVAPAELEAILLNHSNIADVGVVGLPDERAGELPLAFIVRNGKLTEKEVDQFLEGKVSNFKKLRGGVIFVNEIPKNASGKILRRKLREMLKQYKSKL